MAETLTRKWRTRIARHLNTNDENVLSVEREDTGLFTVTCVAHPTDPNGGMVATLDMSTGVVEWV